jgi:hypothetical protein
MNVKRSVSVSGAELELSEIGRNRMLGFKVDGLLQQLQQAGGEGDATLTFCKCAGGYRIHGSMWKPERD